METALEEITFIVPTKDECTNVLAINTLLKILVHDEHFLPFMNCFQNFWIYPSQQAPNDVAVGSSLTGRGGDRQEAIKFWASTMRSLDRVYYKDGEEEGKLCAEEGAERAILESIDDWISTHIDSINRTKIVWWSFAWFCRRATVRPRPLCDRCRKRIKRIFKEDPTVNKFVKLGGKIVFIDIGCDSIPYVIRACAGWTEEEAEAHINLLL